MSTTASLANPAPLSRIASIDLIRGAVMIVMAIDHVRVYSGLPAGGPTPGIFFTRWITHFCAPAFIFLAGTSIFLYARKHADVSGGGVSKYLLIRGAWLIFLELTFLRVAWTFNFDFRHYEMAGVIWVAFGKILTFEPTLRKRVCLAIGLSAIALFLILRGFNLYGDPRPWHVSPVGRNGAPPLPALFSFLNTAKYPASLDFLLMTLGPIITLIPLVEGLNGAIARRITLFGRVPFFYYMLHIPLIHALALIVSKIRLGFVSPWLFTNHPMGNPEPPEGYVWNLPLLYLIWAIAIVLLYFACRWFAALKARRTDWWLQYL